MNRPTVVFYSDARTAKLALLENAITQGVAIKHDPVDIPLLQRVQAGLLASPLTPIKIKNTFTQARQQGLT